MFDHHPQKEGPGLDRESTTNTDVILNKTYNTRIYNRSTERKTTYNVRQSERKKNILPQFPNGSNSKQIQFSDHPETNKIAPRAAAKK